MEKFIISNNCALRIGDTGKGDKVVVLIHGYLESMNVFDEFTFLLSPSVRVVSLDLPGHGISEVKGEVHSMEFLADTVIGVLDSLGIEKATLVGHSMGGYVSLATLAKHPSRIEGLVLMHSTAYADNEEKIADRDREIAVVLGGHKELLVRTAPQRRFAEANRRRLASVISDQADEIFICEEEGIVALLRGMQGRVDQNEMLRNSPVPQLLIYGLDDSYIPNEKAERMIADNPQAKAVWMEHSGHMAFLEEPELCAKTILDFVAGL